MTKTSKPKAFTGTTVALADYGRDNLFQLVLLVIKDGVVVSQETISDPDSPSICIAKAESLLWSIRSESLK